MKKLLTTTGIIAFTILQMSAQTFEMLPYTNKAKIATNDKGTDALCDTTINFDGVNTSAISNVAIGYMHFNNEELRFYKQGLTLNGVQFYINDNTFDSVGIEIHENVTTTNGGLSNSQLVLGTMIYDSILPKAQVLSSSSNLHELGTPLTLDTALGYAVGIRVYTSTGDFFLGTDAGPSTRGKGDWILSGGNIVQLWSISSLDFDWNIKACISGDVHVPSYSANLSSVEIDPIGYELLPLSHVDPNGYTYSGSVLNNGLLSVTNPTLTATVSPGSYSGTGTVGTLASGLSTNLSMSSPFVPTATGDYTAFYSLDIDETDFLLTDNFADANSFSITDSIYARVEEGSTPIATDASYALDGEENNIFGVRYDLIQDDFVSFITADFENPYEGARYIGEIYEYDVVNDEVGSLLISSDTMEFTDVVVNEIYSPIIGFPEEVYLLAGSYIIAINELDGFEFTGIMYNSNYAAGVAFTNSAVAGSEWLDNGDFWTGDFVWSNRLHLGATVITEVVKGIEDAAVNNLSIYPNPAKGNVAISGTKAGATVQILDVTGKIVINEVVKSSTTSIDLTTIEKGIYVVKYINENTVSTEKLIVE